VYCQFYYDARDEPLLSPEKIFKSGSFNMLVNTAFMSAKERFQRLRKQIETWGSCTRFLPKREELIIPFRYSHVMDHWFQCRYQSNTLTRGIT